ncbi:MAG: adenylate kinase [Chloroflexi bacterium]|nr:adenylate kinase [Chloroflexota bacterium]
MYTVLIGAPGAGKGTQATEVKPEVGPHLASGDMFRDAMAEGTPLGVRAKAYVERGELVPDEVTVAMVLERLGRSDCAVGALLDGFPRTLGQAEALDRELGKNSKRVDQALYLAVPEDELIRRLSGRWICRVCQTPYHEVSQPPKTAGICDKCGGELFQRVDDTIETAQKRLGVYFDQTAPLIDYYRARGVLDEVDGSLDVGRVRDQVLAAVRRRKSI